MERKRSASDAIPDVESFKDRITSDKITNEYSREQTYEMVEADGEPPKEILNNKRVIKMRSHSNASDNKDDALRKISTITLKPPPSSSSAHHHSPRQSHSIIKPIEKQDSNDIFKSIESHFENDWNVKTDQLESSKVFDDDILLFIF